MRKASMFLMVLLAATMLMAIPAAYAQDDLSDDEQALLDRLLVVAENEVEYDSYISTYSEVNTQNQALDVGDGSEAQATSQEITLEAEREISRSDEPFGRATINATVSQSNPQTDLTIGIAGDVRFVDGDLYANLSATEGQDAANAPAFLSELSGDWEQVTDPQGSVAYQILGLQAFRDSFDVDEANPNSTNATLDTIEQLTEFANSITQETVEIDGESFDEISINFAGDGMVAYLEATGGLAQDGSAQVLTDALSALEGEVLTIALVVTEEDTVVGRRVNADIEVELAANELSPSYPEGSTFTLGIGIQQSETLTNINEAIEPVEAPDVPAPETTPEATEEASS